MIIQGRYLSEEAVDQLKINASLDGEEWVSHGLVDLQPDDHYNGYIAQLTPSVNAKFVRLIPVTDRAMPICIRTEFFGCYRTDHFIGYELVTTPLSETPEYGLDSTDFGIGRLVDGITDDYLKFAQKAEVHLEWSKAVNISELVIYGSQRAGACVEMITLKIGGDNYRYSDIPCSVGNVAIPLLVNHVLHELTVMVESEGMVEISEIEWTKTAELKPIKMDPIESVSDTDVASLVASWLPLAAVLFGAIVIIIVIFVCVIMLRRRFRMNPKNHQYESSTATTTLRLIPSRATSANYASNSYLQRSDILVRVPPARNLSAASHVTANSYNNAYYYSNSSPKKESGHEYSEIGSMTADSGNGESLEGDKPSYAELNIV